MTAELKAGQTQPVTSQFGKTDQSDHKIYVIEVAEPADPIAVKTKTAVPTPLYTTMNQTSVPTPPANTPETDTNVPTPPTSSTEVEHGMVPNEPTTDQHESTPPEQSGEQTSVESDTDNSQAQGSAVVTTGKLQSNHSQNVVHTQNAQQLPQTNESSESLMTWIGLSLLALFGSLASAFSGKKRHDA